MTLNLTALLWICLLGALTPGPSLMVILSVAAREGARAGALASWAHAVGVGLWATLSLSGWSYTLRALPELVRWVSAGASAYLIFLASRLEREALSPAPPPLAPHSHSHPRGGDGVARDPHTERSGAWGAPLAGFMISVSNPKLLLFFTSIYPQVLPPHPISGASLWIALLTPVVVDGAWYHLASSLSSRAGLLGALERQRRLVAALSALLFLGVALQGLC